MICAHWKMNKTMEKKVLLRETPRHNLSKHILSRGGTYLGYPLSWPGQGVPTLNGGGTYLGVPPHPDLTWGTPCPDLARGYLPRGTPHPDLAGGVPTLGRGYLPWGTTSWPGWGYLPWTEGVATLGYPPFWPGRGRYLPRWVLPLGVDRQTPEKTIPSRRTTYAGGKNSKFGLKIVWEKIKEYFDTVPYIKPWVLSNRLSERKILQSLKQ